MGLRKRKVIEETWIESRHLQGEVLLRPLTARLEAEYRQKCGLHMTGMEQKNNQDGTQDFMMAVAATPIKMYDSNVWLMGKLIAGLRGCTYEDGDAIEWNEKGKNRELFELLAETADMPREESAFDELVDAAKALAGRRAEEEEKN